MNAWILRMLVLLWLYPGSSWAQSDTSPLVPEQVDTCAVQSESHEWFGAEVEWPENGLGAGAADGVKITSPAGNSTVGNKGGPLLSMCLTENDVCLKIDDENLGCRYRIYVGGKAMPAIVQAKSPAIHEFDPILKNGTYEVRVDYECISSFPFYEVIFKSELVEFHVDAIAPILDFSVERPMNEKTTDRNAQFRIASNELNSKIWCKMDSSNPRDSFPFKDCTHTREFKDLEVGVHTFFVYAVDVAGNESNVSEYEWEILPLKTTIKEFPRKFDEKTDTSFSFLFEGSAEYTNGVTFECSLSGPSRSHDFKSCISPKKYSGLADGSYSFAVRAVDKHGNREAPPVSYAWSVDATPPGLGILLPIEDRKMNSVVFSGTVDDSLKEIKLSIENHGDVEVVDVFPRENVWELAWKASVEGQYQATVEATNWSGLKTKEVRTIVVDKTPPVQPVVMGPPGKSNSRKASFNFACEGEVAEELRFECLFDSGGGGKFLPCGAVYELSDLDEKQYKLLVRAVDEAGNVGNFSSPYVWTVLITLPPSPRVLQPVHGVTIDTQTPIVSGVAQPHSVVTIIVDGQKIGTAAADDSGAWSFQVLVPLADQREHSLTTEATDAGGNVSAQRSDEHVFTIVANPEVSNVIGGGLNWSSSGAGPSALWCLLGGVVWSAWRRRQILWRN